LHSVAAATPSSTQYALCSALAEDGTSAAAPPAIAIISAIGRTSEREQNERSPLKYSVRIALPQIQSG
jgi:hypothetical protein